MKNLLLVLFTVFSIFCFGQNLHLESVDSGYKEDLSDLKKGTLLKITIFEEEKYLLFRARDKERGIEIDVRAEITFFEKVSRGDSTAFLVRSTLPDGSELGDLNIALTVPGRNIFAAELEGLYFVGKYEKF